MSKCFLAVNKTKFLKKHYYEQRDESLKNFIKIFFQKLGLLYISKLIK